MKTELYVYACKYAYLWRLTWSVLRWRYCGTAGMDCGGDGLHRSKVATYYRSSSRSTESCRADDETQNEDSGADNGWRPSTGSSVVSAIAVQTPWKQILTSLEPPDRQPSQSWSSSNVLLWEHLPPISEVQMSSYVVFGSFSPWLGDIALLPPQFILLVLYFSRGMVEGGLE